LPGAAIPLCPAFYTRPKTAQGDFIVKNGGDIDKVEKMLLDGTATLA
jgi:hypothetical protein